VITALSRLRKATWTLVSHNAQVVGLEGDVLTVGFATPGLREQFVRGNHEPPLKQAITDVIGADWRIEAIVDQGTQPASMSAAPPAAPPVTQQAAPAQPAAGQAPAGQASAEPRQRQAHDPQTHEPQAHAPSPAPGSDTVGPPPPWDEPAPAAAERQGAEEPRSDASRRAREAIQPTRLGGAPDAVAERSPVADLADRDADVRPDDQPFEEEQLGGAELLQRELGAQIIEEIRHQ
jgi:DNA polymerase-3 subunit gamma/tau